MIMAGKPSLPSTKGAPTAILQRPDQVARLEYSDRGLPKLNLTKKGGILLANVHLKAAILSGRSIAGDECIKPLSGS